MSSQKWEGQLLNLISYLLQDDYMYHIHTPFVFLNIAMDSYGTCPIYR